jgi:hypothetical protein
VVYIGGLVIRSRYKSPLRLTELAVVVPGKVIPLLDALMAEANFSTPAGRQKTLASLAAILDPNDVRDGWVRLRGESKSDKLHLKASVKLYQDRMIAAGLSESDGQTVIAERAEDPPSPACVLGLITTTVGPEPVEEGGSNAARDLLKGLESSTGPNPLLLYVYYAPEPRQQLTEEQAGEMLWSLAPGE